MSEFFKILASLVKPLFNGILQVLKGGLGWAAFLVGWVQVGLQLSLAANHSSGFWSGAFIFVGLFLVQMLCALLSFSMMTGAAFEPDAKKRPSPLESMVAMFFWSAVLSFLLNGALLLAIGVFASVAGVWPLLILDSAIAAFQAIAVFFALNRAVSR